MIDVNVSLYFSHEEAIIRKAYFRLAQKYHPDKNPEGRVSTRISVTKFLKKKSSASTFFLFHTIYALTNNEITKKKRKNHGKHIKHQLNLNLHFVINFKFLSFTFFSFFLSFFFLGNVWKSQHCLWVSV